MSDKVGPRSSSPRSDTDFEWSAWNHGQDDGESTWKASESTRSEDTDSAPNQNEPEQDRMYAPSDAPPPVIDAFPEQPPHQAPAPEEAADPWSIPWPVTVIGIAVSLIVIVLVVAIVAALTHHGGTNEPSATTPTTTPSTVAAPPTETVTSEETVTDTVTSTLSVTTPPPVTTSPYDPEGASLQQLQAWANADRAAVLKGATNPDRWVPQLGSKKLGTVDNGTTYNYARILQDFLQLKNRYPGASPQLLRSGDWSTFGESDYWVTIAGMTYPTASGALGWCVNNNLDNDHCYAKLISTTQGVEGSTAYQ